MENNNISLSLDSDMGSIGGGFSSEILSLAETDKKEEDIKEENLEYSQVVSYIMSQFTRAKQGRYADEQRWLECWQNYRGNYGPEVQFTDTEKSQAFIKITKTKVLAAFAQITEILFSGSKFPIGIQPSPIPEGIAEEIYLDPKEPKNPEGKTPEKILRSATITRDSIKELIDKKTKAKIEQLPEEKLKDVKEGPGLTPTSYTWEPAAIAARGMEKQIHDQLEEADASKSLRHSLFESCLFGTLIFKGPFARRKEYPKWDESGKYVPVMKDIPDVNHVSIWNAYPDPDARMMSEAEYFIERHRMTKTDLRALKKRPHFRSESIEIAIKEGATYVPEWWETYLEDGDQQPVSNRFVVLEYWGIIDREITEDTGFDFPEEYKDMDQVQVNIWVCNGQILRLVLNPFTPSRIPYYICPYEINPYSIFGIGVAENMLDTQLIMNGFMRLAVDNAILSSNVVFELNETNLVPGQNLDLYPGKIFRTNGQVGQSIHAMKIPNVTNECIMMFDKARQLADESTGMPSYSHGMSGVMGVGRTASGMSMLMGAAKENIKSVVRNVDDYLLVPLGKALFAFNMQFNFNKDYIGDLEVIAKGTDSLMRNEIRGQKLLQFYQLTANPQDAAFVKRDYLLRELALSLDLDPDKLVNDPREAGIQAEILAEINKKMGIDPNAAGGSGNPGSPPGLNDPTGNGGGTVAPGQAPPPGAEGFSAGGGNNNPNGNQSAQQSTSANL